MCFGKLDITWGWSINPLSHCFNIWLSQDIVKYSLSGLLSSSRVRVWISNHLGQSVENFGVLKIDNLRWTVELDSCPQILKGLLNTLCRFLMGELGNGEVNEIVCGVNAIVDVIPQLVPEHRAGKRILDFVEIKLERSERTVIESNFSVSMISMVNLISFDRSTNVYLNFVEFL